MKPTMSIIDIVVSDIDAPIAFYGKFGVDFQVDPAYPGHAGADLPGGIHLMLDTEGFIRTYLPDWTAPTGDSRTVLCFGFDSPAEVDAKHAELAEAGYRASAEPFDAVWGMRYATVLDPDGTSVNLYSPLPDRPR
jgi:predicted lactoylglutathione lyase